jgi:trehalose synthase
MAELMQVQIGPLHPERFEEVLTREQYADFHRAIEAAQGFMADRVVWNVNSTAVGGGVAEMLRSLLAYARGAKIDARWLVIGGNPAFFKVTKRIHNHLHGAKGDGGKLGDEERRDYEQALEPNGRELKKQIKARDVVVLHDPQTAGLIPIVKETGALVVWRCHVGLDMPNELSRDAWRFLIPYVNRADAYVFSRDTFAWQGLDAEKTWVIPPSIDAFSPKNQELEQRAVLGILNVAGLLRDGGGGEPVFASIDGSKHRVVHRADIFEEETLQPDTKTVVQVSRWDRLKDPLGVIRGFAEHVDAESNAHLVYAGPAVEAVSDDPEGAEVLAEAIESWQKLPSEHRRRIHLACLPMDDGEENAAIVNALQRHASVVVQKSLAEGFGLTVAEAMWKARPVVASKIGGIQDQIQDGQTGVLVEDPTDLAEFGRAVMDLIRDDERARRLGENAQREVRDHFLGPRHLIQYVELIGPMLE